MSSRQRQSGLTLVELLIAATLGLIVVGALVAVFVSNSQNYRQNDAISSLQDNARFALDTLSRDLAMAGYWGGVRARDAGINVSVSDAAAASVSTSAMPGDCGPASPSPGQHWLFNVSTPIEFHDHLDTTAITSLYRCLNHVAPHTDVVVVRHAAGQPAADLPSTWVTNAALIANRIYIKTNQNVASIVQASNSMNVATPTDCPGSGGLSVPCPPSSYPAQYLAYRPYIYYVRDYLNTVGDGLTILCRRYLDDSTATPSMAEDCLAEGVENLQLEWGIDTVNSSPPITVTRYVSAPTAAQLQQALAVRIHILVRSTANNVTVNQDSKSYILGNYDSTQFADFVNKGILRRAFTTTVQLKNLSQ